MATEDPCLPILGTKAPSEPQAVGGGQRGSKLSGCQSPPFLYQTATEEPCLPILGTKYGRGGSEGQRLRENCDPRIPLGNDEKHATARVAWCAERMRLTQAVSPYFLGKCACSADLASEQRTWPCQKKENLFLVCPSLHFLNSVLRWPKIINFYKV